MPRRRPGPLRALSRQGPVTPLEGVPNATSHQLDRLARPEISSATVRQALDTWEHVACLTAASLRGPHNDWTEIIGPLARTELEAALRALPRRHLRALRAVIERADEEFAAKTLPNPRADPAQPWWARRWSDM